MGPPCRKPAGPKNGRTPSLRVGGRWSSEALSFACLLASAIAGNALFPQAQPASPRTRRGVICRLALPTFQKFHRSSAICSRTPLLPFRHFQAACHGLTPAGSVAWTWFCTRTALLDFTTNSEKNICISSSAGSLLIDDEHVNACGGYYDGVPTTVPTIFRIRRCSLEGDGATLSFLFGSGFPQVGSQVPPSGQCLAMRQSMLPYGVFEASRKWRKQHMQVLSVLGLSREPRRGHIFSR